MSLIDPLCLLTNSDKTWYMVVTKKKQISACIIFLAEVMGDY
jgi:hypothetical protein